MTRSEKILDHQIHPFKLERQKDSKSGQYIRRMMARGIEALRIDGDIRMIFGAWYHSVMLLMCGLLIIISAWLTGLFAMW